MKGNTQTERHLNQNHYLEFKRPLFCILWPRSTVEQATSIMFRNVFCRSSCMATAHAWHCIVRSAYASSRQQTTKMKPWSNMFKTSKSKHQRRFEELRKTYPNVTACIRTGRLLPKAIAHDRLLSSNRLTAKAVHPSTHPENNSN